MLLITGIAFKEYIKNCFRQGSEMAFDAINTLQKNRSINIYIGNSGKKE